MVLAALKETARAGFNAVLPPLCLACSAINDSTQAFCGACWKNLHFIAAPYCVTCGLPFEFTAIEGAQCGECLLEAPQFIAARAALSYTPESRNLILPFKSQDRTDFAPAFARLMAQAGKEMLEASDVVVPVPLHPFRLFARRYNQAAILAQRIAKQVGKHVALDVLQRKYATPSQGTLHRSERQKNVARAFMVTKSGRKKLAGKNVLLIDDVLTTGATANACAKTLLQAGVKEVRVLALARVKKGH
jgi:ComF family protein